MPTKPGTAATAPVTRRLPDSSVAAACGAVAGLLVCAPSPTAAVRTLREPLLSGAVDVTAPVVALVSLLAWVLAGWLLLAAALTACTRLPGAAGRAGAAVLRRVAPATVRRCLAVALGITVVTAVAGPAAASHTGAGAGPAAPSAAVAAGTPLLDWPTTRVAEPAPAEAPAAEPVVVRPGDSLWALAERSLPDGATQAQVAASWPSWWAANRHVIGDDPDLLRPGAVLTPPASR